MSCEGGGVSYESETRGEGREERKGFERGEGGMGGKERRGGRYHSSWRV